MTVAFNGMTFIPSFVKIDPVVQRGYKCKQARTVALESNSATGMFSMGFVYTRAGRTGFRQAGSMVISFKEDKWATFNAKNIFCVTKQTKRINIPIHFDMIYTIYMVYTTTLTTVHAIFINVTSLAPPGEFGTR
jgi:hypothetical protein